MTTLPRLAPHPPARSRALTLLLAAAWLVAPAAAEPMADVPSGFAVEGRQVVMTLQAVGAQIYACTTKSDGMRAWSFREPIATLMQDGKTIGRHYAGPNWDVTGGGVTGRLVASVPGATADDVPELELQVIDRHGAGALTDAQTVLRLHTVGGTLAGPCERNGDLKAVPYRADYVFLR